MVPVERSFRDDDGVRMEAAGDMDMDMPPLLASTLAPVLLAVVLETVEVLVLVFQMKPLIIDLEEVQPVLSGAFNIAGDTEGSKRDLRECDGSAVKDGEEEEDPSVGELLAWWCEIGDGEDNIIMRACEVGPFGVGGHVD